MKIEKRKSDILEKLEEDSLKTASFFETLDEVQLSKQVYNHGAAWNVRQVLAHLITIEYSMQKLFENMLEGGQGAPEDFNLERYNRSQPPKLDSLSADELIERFKVTRQRTISIVSMMQEEDLDRTGNHPYHGHSKLEKFIRWAYQHAQHHINIIKDKFEWK